MAAQKTYLSPMMLLGRQPRRLQADWVEPTVTPTVTVTLNPGMFYLYQKRRDRRRDRGMHR